MNTRLILRLLAVASLLTPGVRLLAASDDLSTTIRNMNLDLMEKTSSEASEREAARARTARLSAATYDLNRDGKLDDREFAAWEKEVRTVMEQTPKMMKKYDRNHDRKLDDAEWTAARAELFGQR